MRVGAGPRQRGACPGIKRRARLFNTRNARQSYALGVNFSLELVLPTEYSETEESPDS